MNYAPEEAQQRFSHLLERVAAGEVIRIIRNGVVIARLMPPAREDKTDQEVEGDGNGKSPEADDTAKVAATIQRLLQFRKAHTLNGLTIRGMINEGRRF